MLSNYEIIWWWCWWKAYGLLFLSNKRKSNRNGKKNLYFLHPIGKNKRKFNDLYYDCNKMNWKMKQNEKNIAAETSNQTLNSVNNITLDLISNNIEVEMLILCIFSWYWLTFVSSTNRLSILLTFHIELSVLKKKLYVHGWIAEVCVCLEMY